MKTSTPRAKTANRRSAEATARLNRILEVTRRLMIQRGFHHTSLDEVVAKAGGSKATLRKYFGNKAGLLAAVMADAAEHCIGEAKLAAESQAPADALEAFGCVVLTFYLQPDSIAIYRGVIAEGARHRPLAQAFYERGHAQFVAALADRLKTWHNEGIIDCRDPVRESGRFLHMIRSDSYERVLIGLTSHVTSGEIKTQVQGAVRLFLQGVRR